MNREVIATGATIEEAQEEARRSAHHGHAGKQDIFPHVFKSSLKKEFRSVYHVLGGRKRGPADKAVRGRVGVSAGAMGPAPDAGGPQPCASCATRSRYSS